MTSWDDVIILLPIWFPPFLYTYTTFLGHSVYAFYIYTGHCGLARLRGLANPREPKKRGLTLRVYFACTAGGFSPHFVFCHPIRSTCM